MVNNTKAYSAASATSPLAPTRIRRRLGDHEWSCIRRSTRRQSSGEFTFSKISSAMPSAARRSLVITSTRKRGKRLITADSPLSKLRRIGVAQVRRYAAQSGCQPRLARGTTASKPPASVERSKSSINWPLSRGRSHARKMFQSFGELSRLVSKPPRGPCLDHRSGSTETLKDPYRPRGPRTVTEPI